MPKGGLTGARSQIRSAERVEEAKQQGANLDASPRATRKRQRNAALLSLQQFVDVLNNGFYLDVPWREEAHANFVKLTRALLDTPPVSVQNLVPKLLRMKWPAGGPSSLHELNKGCKSLLGATASGAYPIVSYDGGRDRSTGKTQPWNAWDLACYSFVALIQNREIDRLGGPCEYHLCGNYFIVKTRKSKRYCSPGCASKGCAKILTKQDRANTLNRKLDAANKTIQRWRPRRGPWKQFVANYDKQVEITPKWLTRMVNEGKLRPPQ